MKKIVTSMQCSINLKNTMIIKIIDILHCKFFIFHIYHVNHDSNLILCVSIPHVNISYAYIIS